MARTLSTEIIELPIGYTDKDGNIHTLCEISEMTGADEEAITDKKVATNPAVVITTLLARKIVRIGDIEKITPALVKSLYTADRDAILLAIRKLSLGEIMKFTVQCKSCGEKFEYAVDLDKDIESPSWDDIASQKDGACEERGYINFELPVGHEDKDGDVHKDGVLRLPIGDVEERLAVLLRQNAGKANTALLCACIQQLGELKMVDTKILRDMTRRDREYLTSIMRDYKCGPNFMREVECPYCGNSFTISLELPYFFTANSDL